MNVPYIHTTSLAHNILLNTTAVIVSFGLQHHLTPTTVYQGTSTSLQQINSKRGMCWCVLSERTISSSSLKCCLASRTAPSQVVDHKCNRSGVIALPIKAVASGTQHASSRENDTPCFGKIAIAAPPTSPSTPSPCRALQAPVLQSIFVFNMSCRALLI